MSSSKIKMILYSNQVTTQNQEKKESVLLSKKNMIKLGFNGVNRNCAALYITGNKHCKSCNGKK